MGFPEDREDSKESTVRRFLRRKGGDADEGAPRRSRDDHEEPTEPKPADMFAEPSRSDAEPSRPDAFTVPDRPRRAGRASRAGNPYAPVAKSAETAEEAPPPPPRRETWSPYTEGRKSRGPLWFAIGGLAVMGALVAGLITMYQAGGSTPTGAEAERRTSDPLPSPPPGKFSYAGARKTDPEPLTVKELFPAKKFGVSGRSYEMTVTNKAKKCTDGAVGDKIQKALKAGKCTQLIRASFRDKAGKVIGTVGVANLNTSASAGKVASAGSKANYVKPLAGKDAVTKLVGSGSGGANAWMHGHYAVMIWFQNKDGSNPDKKAQKAIKQAVEDITQATVFKALDARAVTGFPAS